MATDLPDSDEPTRSDSSRMRSFAKYSGLGMQMLATIGLSAWAGVWLDKHYHTGPWGTVVLTLLGVFAAMYQVIRSVS